MEIVTLKFRSVSLLWGFKQTIKAHEIEINFQKCILLCNCSDAETTLAIEKFGAEIVTERSED